jgi:hypothetical protein
MRDRVQTRPSLAGVVVFASLAFGCTTPQETDVGANGSRDAGSGGSDVGVPASSVADGAGSTIQGGSADGAVAAADVTPAVPPAMDAPVAATDTSGTVISDGGPGCTNGCPVGEKRCAAGGTGLQECSILADRCSGWGPVTPCPTSRTCVQSGTGASCACPPDTEACGNACANLRSDAKNCGACGHDCLGGECRNGSCQPFRITGSAISAVNVAVTADSAFVVDYGGGGRLLKISKSDGAIVPLAGGGVAGVAVSGGRVFWTAAPTFGGSDGKVIGAGFDGTNLVEIASGQTTPGAIAADGTGVYWLNAGPDATSGVVMAAPAGRTPAPVASGQARPASIATDAGNVYWFNVGATDGSDGAVYRVPKTGGSAVLLAEAQPNATGSPLSLFVRGDRVYFTPRGLGNTDGHVRSVSTAGGAVTEYARDQVRPQGVVADDAFVYWVDYGNGSDGLVQKAGLGTRQVTQLVGGLVNPLGIAVDDVAIYFTTAGGASSPGGLYRLAK